MKKEVALGCVLPCLGANGHGTEATPDERAPFVRGRFHFFTANYFLRRSIRAMAAAGARTFAS